MRGRVLEAFLKAERGLASCGRGSQPRIGRSGSRPSGTKCTGREVIATSFGANAGVGSADPRPKIAKVERRKASAPKTRCTPRLVNAAQFAPFGAPPPLIEEAAKKFKTRALRRRGNEVALFDIVSSPAGDADPAACSTGLDADAATTPRLQSGATRATTGTDGSGECDDRPRCNHRV
jgi:hypothetical protein